jgi:hypothetical protein
LVKLSPQDVFLDAIKTAILIGLRGASSNSEYAELLAGIKKMGAFVYSSYFSLDSAILCASKVAYLSALIVKQSDSIDRFKRNWDIASWNIANQDYNRLNKLKKTSPEAFYYFFQALTLLDLDGS